MLREQYEHFHNKTKKRGRPGKYKSINDILYEWYQKCCSSNFDLNGPLLKEEAMEIKNQLENSDLDGFFASDGWLEKWKATYTIKEKRIVGEGGDGAEETVSTAFFVSAAGQKIDKPIVIWKSKLPRCFKEIRDAQGQEMSITFQIQNHG